MLAVKVFALSFLLVIDLSDAKICKSSAESSVSTNSLEAQCSETEYSSYVECIRKRAKRHAPCSDECDDCEDSCDDCDCNFCSYNDCGSQCNDCCSSYEPPCKTQTCCHATCRTSCRTSHCRRSCRTRCNKSVQERKEVIVSGSGSHSGSSSSRLDNKMNARHNITTVINLRNVVNNTNIVDMPVMVNNTNINNITLESPEPSPINLQMNTDHQHHHHQAHTITHHTEEQTHHTEERREEQHQQQNCCNLISPRQCVPTQEEPYTRCFHTKQRVCGHICQSSIMHAEPHQVCEQSGNQQQLQCHQQVAYIPQPQPRCFSTSFWPYVSCSVARPSCTGCYSHLVKGGNAPSDCSKSCYDNGINVIYPPGPYQQQLPMLPQACGSSGCMNIGNYGGGNYMPQNLPKMSCGMKGCMGPPGALGGTDMGPYDTGAIQSLGDTFNYRSVLNTNELGDGGSQDHLMMSKRHSEGAALEKKGDKDEQIHYTIEEFPINVE